MIRRQRNALRKTTRRTQRQPRGIILLTTIVAIVIVALALVGLTRRSLRIHEEAVAAVDAIQQKWATHTIRKSLGFANVVLETRQVEPLNPIKGRIQLGRCQCDFVLDDESRKLNINTLWRLGGNRTSRILAELLPQEFAGMIRLQPQDALPHREGLESGEPFESWGQVFQLDAFGVEANAAELLPVLTDSMTCLSPGALNVNHATDDVFRILCEQVVTPNEASRIVQRQRSDPLRALSIILRNVVRSTEKRDRLLSILMNKPNAYSLWIRTRTPGSSRQEFTVRAVDADGTLSERSFSF